MKALVCGGRIFDDTEFMFAELDRLHQEHGFTTVIEGDAKGADRIAGEWAIARGLELKVFAADWEDLGKKAGLLRNEQMLSEGRPDLVIAFPGGRGTFHMCRLAEDAGVELIQLAPTEGATKKPGK